MMATTDAPKTPSTYLLAAEFLLIFGALPLAASIPALGLPKMVTLVTVAAACLLILLRDKTFDRRRLWNGAAAAAAAGDVGRRAFLALIVVVGVVAMLYPDQLLDLPRERPRVWAASLVLYPIVSVYPQEIIYRAFLMHRYRPIFGDGALAVAASAITFSFLHVPFMNWPALLLSLPAGALLALTYRRTGSLAAAWLEHVAYGTLVFTLGLAKFFGVGFLAGRL